MTVVFDSGAFIALEAGKREVFRIIKAEVSAGRQPRTHAGVVGQVWRGGAGPQAPLAIALKSCEVVPLDLELAKRIGVLLSQTGMYDVVDAGVAAICGLLDTLYTSDPDDLGVFLRTFNRRVEIVPV